MKRIVKTGIIAVEPVERAGLVWGKLEEEVGGFAPLPKP